MRLDHVGVATDDATELAALCTGLFETSVAHEETFDGLRVVFVDVSGTDGDDSGPYLELLEPLEDDGSVARFLDREGPGLHHIAVETTDIEATLETVRSLDIDVVDEEPRPGAWGHDVAFLHPRSTGGVLVEFVEH